MQVESIQDLTARLTYDKASLDHRLKKSYAWVLLLLLIAQIGFGDFMFYLYADAFGFKVPSESLGFWTGALVVQVISLVVVVTRYLFPPATSGKDGAD